MTANTPLPNHREAIAALIPHQGRMCLLDSVLECTSEYIVCLSRSHQRPDHPLRHLGRLSAVHLCEYGAQAVAVHGALIQSNASPARPGMLVALRDVKLYIDYLDNSVECREQALQVRAVCVHADSTGCVYDFSVRTASSGTTLASGRVTIMNGSTP